MEPQRQVIPDIAAYWLLQPFLENVTRSSYRIWMPEEQRILRMGYEDPGPAIQNRFSNDFSKSFLNEIREGVITQTDITLMGAICAYNAMEYDVMNGLILMTYKNYSKDKEEPWPLMMNTTVTPSPLPHIERDKPSKP